MVKPSHAVLQDVSQTDLASYSEDIISALNQIDQELSQLKTETNLNMDANFQQFARDQRKNDARFIIGIFSVVLGGIAVGKIIEMKLKKDRNVTIKTAGILEKKQKEGMINEPNTPIKSSLDDYIEIENPEEIKESQFKKLRIEDHIHDADLRKEI